MKENEEIDLLENREEQIEDLNQDFTEEDYKNLEEMEQILNLSIFAFPIYGAAYVLSSISSAHHLIGGVLSLLSAVTANQISKRAELEYIPKSNFNKKLRYLRKRLAPMILALNIASIAVSGFHITKKSFSTAALNKTGLYATCQVLSDYHPSMDTIIQSLEYSISENQLLSKEEQEQIRRLYPYFQENEYLKFLNVYQKLNTLDVLYITDESKKNIAANYDRENNQIHVYNGNSIEKTLPHEMVHITGNLDLAFLREGITSIIAAEYCYEGAIPAAYVSDVYATAIILELVGEDTMLEAYAKEDIHIVLQKLLENSNQETVTNLLDSFEKLCKDYKNRSTDEEKYQNSYQQAKKELLIYLNQKLPCNNPKTMIEEISKRARISQYFEKIKMGTDTIVPKTYYHKTKQSIKIDAENILTFEQAIDMIEHFNRTAEEDALKKY